MNNAEKKRFTVLYTFIVVMLIMFAYIANVKALPVILTGTINKLPPDIAIRTTDINSICNDKTKTLRDVSAKTKLQVYKNAKVLFNDKRQCSKGYEVDHKVALTDGGSNDISNLQLQSYCNFFELTKKPNTNVPLYTGLYDAHKKDALEVTLHSKICKGEISVKDAQSILWNWKN